MGYLLRPIDDAHMVIKATCYNHNFCIDEGDVDPANAPTSTKNSAEVARTDEEGRLIDPSWCTPYQFQPSVTFDSLRDDLVSFIASEGLMRPPT